MPMHFTAFHPDWRLRERPATPAATLSRARDQALANGVRYAYTGNVPDAEGQRTACRTCGARLIERRGYDVRVVGLNDRGGCHACGEQLPGRFCTEAAS